MFNDADKEAVLKSWRLVAPIAENLADAFYERLFELEPGYRRHFPEDLALPKRRLVGMLAFVVDELDWPESEWKADVQPDGDLLLVVLALGRRHAELYGVGADFYARAGEALSWTLDAAVGPVFTLETRAAWERLYALIAQAMRMGNTMIHPDPHAVSAAAAFELGEKAIASQRAAFGLAVGDSIVAKEAPGASS